MTFRREMHYATRLVGFKQRPHKFPVTDIPLDKLVTRVGLHGIEVMKIAGVGQLVQVEDSDIRITQQEKYEVATDESGATRNENAIAQRTSESIGKIAVRVTFHHDDQSALYK